MLEIGIYQHYKGNLYRVYSVATHTETKEKFVCYQSLYGDYRHWLLPLKMFIESVKVDGKIVNRFKFVEGEHERK